MEGNALAFRANKRKTLEAAQKYVQKGALDKALKEYTKLLQVDPSDSNVRLKIGDLHLKRKNPAKAIEAYIEVAELFSRDGFDAKGVAIYKQILRIDPEYVEARVRLGELYQRLGLVSEALREFQSATHAYQERGQKREAFDLLKQLATLDPSNVTNRLTLADLLVREGLEEEARDEFQSLLQEIEGGSSPEEQVRVCEQMLSHFSDSADAIVCLAKAHIELGARSAALDVLRKALVDLPDDLHVREVIVKVYEELGDEEGAGRVYREIAELYKRRGDPDKAREILQRYVPVEPFSEPETPPSMVLRELSRMPSGTTPSPDPRVAAPVSGGPLAGSAGSSEDLLAEARISLEFDNLDDAEARSRQLLECDPHSDGAKQVLAAVLEQRNELESALRLHKERHDLASATGDAELVALVEEDLRRVRGLVSASRPAQPIPESQPDLRDPPHAAGAPLVQPHDMDDAGLDTLPDLEIVLEDEFDRNDRHASIEPPASAGGIGVKPVAAPELDEISELVELELSESRARESARAGISSRGASASWAADSTFIAERIGEAEVLYAQGSLAEAEPLYRAVLERAPHHPQALLRLGEIASCRGESPESAAPAAMPIQLEDTAVQSARPATLRERAERGRLVDPRGETTQPEPLAPEEVEISVDFSDLLDEEEPPETTEPTAPTQLPTPVPETLVDPADWAREEEEEAGDFDLAAELQELDDATGAASSEHGFDTVFRAFKRGIQEQLGAEDADARYDLAIAYREMGLLEDAVEELQIASSAGPRQLQALSVLATTQVELGRPEEAVANLRQALQLAGQESEMTLGLRYDMGVALESCGDRLGALEELRWVAATDPGFRDAVERVAALEAEAAGG